MAMTELSHFADVTTGVDGIGATSIAMLIYRINTERLPYLTIGQCEMCANRFGESNSCKCHQQMLTLALLCIKSSSFS
jgi:hypothetical protein